VSAEVDAGLAGITMRFGTPPTCGASWAYGDEDIVVTDVTACPWLLAVAGIPDGSTGAGLWARAAVFSEQNGVHRLPTIERTA